MAMVIVLWWIALTVVAIFIPMLGLLNALSGGGPPGFIIKVVLPVISWVGVVIAAASVLILFRPALERVVAMAFEPILHRKSPLGRPRFWYFALGGWLALLGSAVGLGLVSALVLFADRDWLGDSWLEWFDFLAPMLFTTLGITAGVAVLVILGGTIAGRLASAGPRRRSEEARASRPVGWSSGPGGSASACGT